MPATPTRFLRLLCLLVCGLLALTPGRAVACTDVLLKSTEGYVHARSMDFHIPLAAVPLVVQRGMSFSSTGSDGRLGAQWKNTYAYAGMESKGMAAGDMLDGINEAGLSIAALWLKPTRFAEKASGPKALASTRLISYLLGTCKNVAEVATALNRLHIWGQHIAALGGVPAVHLACTDAAGGYIVVEFMNGSTKIYENPRRALTNEPEFPAMLAATRQGKKLQGSARRFSLAEHFADSAVFPSQEEARTAAAAFFKRLYLPYAKGKTHTQWVIMKDLQARTFSLYTKDGLQKAVAVPRKDKMETN